MVKLTISGQAPVPIEISGKNGMEEGDEAIFEDQDGEIVMHNRLLSPGYSPVHIYS
jgi:bifunctional DNA-binding transcriptional regulator/antitoxin component of YhaV-PrlF toxin-antitoxin module